MTSHVRFKDDHIEPIMWYCKAVNEIIVDTPSGKYMFHSKTITHPSGIKYLEHNFYRYLYENREWVVTKDIIEFYLAKEEYPMAKLFKLTAYLVDPNDTFDESNLEDYLIWRLRDELDIDHIRLAGVDIGPWHEDHPINNYNCPEAEYEKYFKEN